jgi:predicted CoA-binding protein
MKHQRVAILGASNNPERYAHMAFSLLREHGHEVLPVHPALGDIDGVRVVRSLAELAGSVDTLTLYVRPEIAEGALPEILALRPGRVIFNPGTESPSLRELLSREGIPSVEACTLVLLRTGQF